MQKRQLPQSEHREESETAKMIMDDGVLPVFFSTSPPSVGFIDTNEIPVIHANAVIITMFPFNTHRVIPEYSPPGTWLCFASLPSEVFGDRTELQTFARQLMGAFNVNNVSIVDIRPNDDIVRSARSFGELQ